MPTEKGRQSEEAGGGVGSKVTVLPLFGLAKISLSIQGRLHEVAGLELGS